MPGNRITGRSGTTASSIGMVIRGKVFGTMVQGNTISHNVGDGLRLIAAQGVTIGGPEPGVGNTITNNLGAGLSVSAHCAGSTAQGNTISSNRWGNGEPRSLRSPS